MMRSRFAPSCRRITGRDSQAALHTSALPGPDDIRRVELPNGIVVLARANFNSPSVVISGYLPAGSLFDPVEKLGLANFTAAALMRGTQRRDFQQIYDALESCGAALSIGGGVHTASFSGRSLVEDLPLLLALLSESLRQPVFPAGQVNRLRAQLLTGLAIRAQDTGDMASLAFDEIVYPGHPYSHPEDGYPETIQAITGTDLECFHRETYGPRGMVVAVVGGIRPEEAVEGVAAVLGDWHNPIQPAPPPLPDLLPMRETIVRKVAIPGKSQADVVMGAPGPTRRAPDYMAANLGNSILGQFGMYGRLGEVIRERNGLAYYAYSSLSGGSGPGPWFVSAGVDPANVETVIGLVRGEIERFVSEPVSMEELSDSQAHFIGRLPLGLEANISVAGSLLNLEKYNLGLDYYRLYPDLVNSVTPQDVLLAAQNYLHPARLGIAIAG
ncbi:MAG: M16 family metallopeptidase [Chloroflexota bacterium]